MRMTKQVMAVVLWSWLLVNPVFAQLNVTYPMERMVLQRSNTNQAAVQIAGSFSEPTDRIEIRFTNRISNAQGSWFTLQNNPANGQFNGFFTLAGGWYRLEVRGMNGSTVVGTDAVERFGVGEVFAIFGHSNAQGSTCGDGTWTYTGPNLCASLDGAVDDRVTCVRINENNSATFQSPAFEQYESTANTDYLPGLIGFEKLGTYVGLSPFAKFAWYWGKLGDLLVQQLGVPVLFYNAGFGGTKMEYAYKSAYDIPFCHWFVRYDLRMPYVNLRNLMNLYVPTTGLRAVLLQHGENDFESTTDELKTYHYGVINKFRTEFSVPNMAWLVATSSYRGINFDHVRSAQYQVSHDVTYPYNIPGPDLDQIRGVDRPDDIHFSPVGQEKVAQAWYTSITGNIMVPGSGASANFLTYTQPTGPQTQPLTSVACAPNNQLTVTLPGNYGGSYLWDTGATTQSLTLDAGTYSARLRNLIQINTPAYQSGSPENCTMVASSRTVPGKVFFMPAVTVPTTVKPVAPIVSPSSASVCAGQSVVLTVNGSNPVKWSTNAQTVTITVQNPGIYSVQSVNPVYGCESNVTSVTIAQNPAVTASLSSATVCANAGPITLLATGGSSYSFSTGLVNSTGSLALPPAVNSLAYSVLVNNTSGCSASATGGVFLISGSGPAINSVQSGPWNNPATWSCSCVPGECNPVVINHTVTLADGYAARAQRVAYTGGKLQFGTGASVRVGQTAD